MGLFSGDGSGVSARLFKTYGATILGGLHLKMPDCISDVKALKYPNEKNKQIIAETTIKINQATERIQQGTYPQEGINSIYHMIGLFGQRLWFSHKTKDYSKALKINPTLCNGCQQCVPLCPMQNIIMKQQNPTLQDRCTMCYRCINHCPQKAITLLGKNVVAPYHLP